MMSLRIVPLLVLSLALLCAPLTVLATEAPLVAFVAPGSLNTMLDAPESHELHARGPYVSAKHAMERLAIRRRTDGLPAICDLDAIVHLQVDSLDSDSFTPLQSTSHASSLKRRVMQAPSQLIFPSVDQSVTSFADELKHAMASLCDGAGAMVPSKERIVQIRVPSVHGHESAIMARLEDLDSSYPNHAVIITRTSSGSRLLKRAALHETRKSTKFLERHQLFSPATVLAMGIVAFLVFCTLIAVQMIASTQAPDRLGMPSQLTAYAKKKN